MAGDLIMIGELDFEYSKSSNPYLAAALEIDKEMGDVDFQ